MTPAVKDPTRTTRIMVHPASAGYVSEPTRERYVHPGRVVASAEGHRLTTVLGSCVSVCLFDPGSRVGGMNHFLLPELTPATDRGSARFAGPAFQALLEDVLALGADPRRLEAKVFGGTSPASPALSGFHVGRRNVEVAWRLVATARIPIVRDDVGGPRGRKLVFCTDDGVAWIKLL